MRGAGLWTGQRLPGVLRECLAGARTRAGETEKTWGFAVHVVWPVECSRCVVHLLKEPWNPVLSCLVVVQQRRSMPVKNTRSSNAQTFSAFGFFSKMGKF
jgi:hypothetical protein